MIINAIISLLILVLSLPLRKKSEKLLKESYLEDDFGKQHKLVDDSRRYNLFFALGLLFSLLIIILTALF